MLNKALLLACLAGVAGSASGQVIVTEVFYNPSGAEAETEWVEITNVGITPVDITNYALDDEDNNTPSHKFGAGRVRLANGTILPESADPDCVTVPLSSTGGAFVCDTVNTIIIQPGESIIIGGLWQDNTGGSNAGVDNTPEDFVRAWGQDTDGDGVGDTANYRIILLTRQITIANTADPLNEVLELVEITPSGTLISRDLVNYQVGNSENDWPFSSDGRSIYVQPNFNSTAAGAELIGAAWTLSAPGRDLVVEGREIDTINVNNGNTVGLYGGGDSASPGVHPTVSQSFEDANSNGRDDAIDIFIGFSQDCNRNSVPDEAEADCNSNGIPDACEFQLNQEDDCDGDGQPDDCQIDANPSLDADGNGVLDVCENTAGFGDIIITEIMFDPSGTEREWIEIFNNGSQTVNLAGWFFQDLDEPAFDAPSAPFPGDTDTDGDGVNDTLDLAPGQVLVVGDRTLANWELGWGPVGGAYKYVQIPSLGLANNSDLVNEVRSLIAPAVQPDTTVVNVRIDVANFQGTNSNGVPMGGWPGNDGRGSFYLLASGLGRSANNDGGDWRLSIRSVDGARSPNAAGTFNGLDAGSPGVFNTGAPVRPLGGVIISEIHFATNSDFPGLPFPDETDGIDEWVEILNVSGGTIDLSGWRLEDEDGFTTALPSGATLQDGEAAVIIANDFITENPTPVSEFYDAWECGFQVFTVENWYNGGLNRLGDTAEGGSATNPSTGREILTLRDASDNVHDVVNYDDDGFVWPLVSNGLPFNTAFSIYLFRTADLNELRNDNGLNWATSLAGFDGAISNNLTTVYNAPAFGSPGFVDGVTVNFNPNNCISPDPVLPLCADQNGDGQVAPNDFSAWIANFNAGNLRADVNQDGQVAPNDFSAWIAAFNLGQNGPICP